MEDGSRLRVAIIGGGLVGSLSACFFAQRGHDVELFEYRDDIRTTPHVRGRTINLTLSARGRAALRQVRLEQCVVRQHGLPLEGRMVHSRNGSLKSSLYDVRDKQCIYSVGRRYLNELLLTATEKFPNVKIYFRHKLVSAKLEEGCMTFQTPDHPEGVIHTADLVIGADGAYSSLRRQFLKKPMFNYSQTYIEHGYLELCIPPTADGQFALDARYLHIWPRGSFMMIAMPNQDRTWTVTLFMPLNEFQLLRKSEQLLNFFQFHFPDAIPLIGKERLVVDFFSTSPSPLVSVKCNPYHVGSRAVLIGDAAHAMVPFYGQGMNAGFEDCLLLDELMDQYGGNMSVVLQEYSRLRQKDAEAICDLAMYNYVEMRDLVTRPSFLLRKKLDNCLFKLLPNLWIPLYPSVTFTNRGYYWCLQNKCWQDEVIHLAVVVTGYLMLITLLLILWFSFGWFLKLILVL
ncbi:kynurenine 3-monooxygenase [Anabrus simplex]|uniref:kynurenine 3-monooxygenase n=1 Tax=Anabrus simplex TaxID=316456 RepID=UPI0035A3A096